MHQTQLVRPHEPRAVLDPEIAAIEIRPTRMDDGERVGSFVRGLSLHSQTLRFFAGMSRPNASLLRALIARDERKDVLLALKGEEVVGHAMSVRAGAETEIAVMVTDAWQGRGIGSRLVGRLLLRASSRGVEGVTMDVMGENRKVLAMVRKKWPDATMHTESGSVRIRASILIA